MDTNGDVRRLEQGGSSSVASSQSQELVVKNTFIQQLESRAGAQALPPSSSDSSFSNSQRNLRPILRDSASSRSHSHDYPSLEQSGSWSHEKSGSSSRDSSQDGHYMVGIGAGTGLDATLVENVQLSFDDESGEEDGNGDEDGSGVLLSKGSALHRRGKCRPCLYYLDGKNRCKHGANCAFCHELHHKRRKRPKKKGKEGQGAEEGSAVVLNTTGQASASAVPLPPGAVAGTGGGGGGVAKVAAPLPVGPVTVGYRGPWCSGAANAMSSDDEASARVPRSAIPNAQPSRSGAKCILRL
mmetsp:Transcript_99888/g.287014  ORF Transcript_99888/g.287014 Transcript_99888/m.287014 type:complete len:298 (+) Transcript_99888:60-953(+)